MAKPKKQSPKKHGKELSRKMNEEESAAFIYRFQSEIEKGMEGFDMQKRVKTVKTMEDLGRLVITM